MPTLDESAALLVGGPGDDMRSGWPDLLITAGTPVRLRRRGAGDTTNDPVTIGVFLDALRSAQGHRGLGLNASRMTAGHLDSVRDDVPPAAPRPPDVPGCRTVAALDLSARHVFASDNVAGAHPLVLDAITAANAGHAIAYGDDPWTERAVARVREALQAPDAAVMFTFNGTGANVVGLASLLQPHEAVLCTRFAHILVDECGALTRFSGSSVISLPSEDGRLDVAVIEAQLHGLRDQHHVQPRVVSISQTTEVGTVWQPSHLRELADLAHSYGLYVHLDGARLANAVAALGGDVRGAIAGADVLTLGATKNGGLMGEAIVWLDPALAENARFVRKQATQLASKQRFVAAQIEVLLTDGLWLELAGHANAMARRLVEAVRDVPGLTLSREPEANAIFVRLPHAAIPLLQERSPFYVWDEEIGEVRWVAAWDISEADVDAFAKDVRDVLRSVAADLER